MGSQVMVVGLGRFGRSAAIELEALGHEVLAVDRDETLVSEIAPRVTHAVQLDATDPDALAAVGAGDFPYAIVAISSHAEASIVATMALREVGVGTIVAKAATELQGRILERVGAARVVYPERETGLRVAHTLQAPHVLHYLDLAPRYGVARVRPWSTAVGRTVGELDLGVTHRLNLIAILRGTTVLVNPHREERIMSSDELLLLGRDEQLARVSAPASGGRDRTAEGAPPAR